MNRLRQGITVRMSFRQLGFTLIAVCTLLRGSSVAESLSSVELPMRLINGMPAVEVYVNGQGPFVFRIDTGGAGQARVDTALVQKLNLPKIGEARGSDGSESAVPMQVVKIDVLKLGTLEFKNVEAPARDYNRNASSEHIDGILCFGLFAEHLFTLDFPTRKVKLNNGTLPAPDGVRVLPFTMANGIPSVKLNLAGTETEANIDSGNMTSGFMFGEAHASKLQFKGEPVVVGRARTVSREFEIKEAVAAGEIRLGAYRFPAPIVRFAEIFPHDNIGVAVLREFALTFDQKNRRVRWEREGEVIPLISAPQRTVMDETTAPLREEYRVLVGTYGQRMISLVDGKLYLQRTGGPQLALVKLGPDEFGLADVPEARIKFVKDSMGKVTEIRVRNRQGEWESSPRTN